jgi:hypothetical protein
LFSFFIWQRSAVIRHQWTAPNNKQTELQKETLSGRKKEVAANTNDFQILKDYKNIA